MNYNLTVAISLSNRTLTSTIPDDTEITELKYIAKVDSNNYIAEDVINGVSTGYFSYLDENDDQVIEKFYEYDGSTTITNVSSINMPDNFGAITEIDEEAVLYEYITRNSHEKVYVHSEDFDKRETLEKNDILTEIDETVRGYGVPVDTVIGWTGLEEDIPGGFEKTDESFGGGAGETLPIGSELDYSGSFSDIPDGWEQVTSPDSYSTTEVKTNKTWIDGKPIYRKVVNIENLPNRAEKQVAHGIANIENIINIYGFANDGTRTIPLPFISVEITTGSTSASVYILANNTNITLGAYADRSAFSGYATIEYTKTTD